MYGSQVLPICRLQAVWNLTDKSDEFCERIIATDFHKDMLENLTWRTWSEDKLNNSLSESKKKFLEAHIGALHNIVRRIESALGAFRQLKAADTVQKFRKVSHFPVLYFSLLFSYIRRCLIICFVEARK